MLRSVLELSNEVVGTRSHIKVNEYAFRGSNSIFCFALLLIWDQLLKVREQTLSSKSRSYFGRDILSWEAKRMSQKLSPCDCMVEKHDSVPLHLNP